MKELKAFQERAKNELFDATERLWDSETANALLVFRSPTGSGKTFTMTKYIERVQMYANEKNMEVVYLWISIGKGGLEKQSYASLKKDLLGDTHVYTLEEVQHKDYLDCGDVVVFNWEKVRSKDRKGNWKNIAMRDGERGNFIDCLEQTRKNGTKILLIIDESHSQAQADRAKELRNEVVNADLTIEVSATPILKGYKHLVSVEEDDPIKEEMIKKAVRINHYKEEGDTDTILLKNAFEKRQHLKRLFEKEGSNINPLCLIQIPNSERGDDKKLIVEEFLDAEGVNIGNGKLAVHLTDEKINQESEVLSDNDNEVEFLMFKQAIDTGWDCPRAHILVKYRETGSIIFELQTVGRILRMPEQRYYDEEDLNFCYVYTNDDRYEIKQEKYNPNIIKKFGGKRKDIYQSLGIKSYYQKRTDFGDIEADFYLEKNSIARKVFRNKLGVNKTELKSKLNIDEFSGHEENIMVNETVQSKLIDFIVDEEVKAKFKKRVKTSDNDLMHLFNGMIRQNLQGFAPVRSTPTVSEAIKVYFIEDIGIDPRGRGIIYIQNICLNNPDKFTDAVRSAIEEYKPFKEEKNKEEMENAGESTQWEIPGEYYYNPQIKDREIKDRGYKKYIFDKSYINFDSNLEKEFADTLDKAESVLWWWKNGSEHMRENFGIKYEKGGKNVSTFQPDFIVQFTDGRIGIFDTKDQNDRKEVTKEKAEALQKYIRDAKKKDLFGGIVIQDGSNFYINSKATYKTFTEKRDDWNLSQF